MVTSCLFLGNRCLVQETGSYAIPTSSPLCAEIASKIIFRMFIIIFGFSGTSGTIFTSHIYFEPFDTFSFLFKNTYAN